MTHPLKVPAKAGYHHANLRRALLDAAINHLRDAPVATLTVKQLARDAKVSPGAPYHHFKDRQELLAALATEGFERWIASASTVAAAPETPSNKLANLARAWLAFAAEHTPHYRVMFLSELADRQRFATMHAAAAQALELLVGVLREAMPDAADGRRAERAVIAWSTLHGFASLRMNGVLGNIPGVPELEALEDAAAASMARLVLDAADS